MKLNENEKNRVIRYFEEEIDPYDFTETMGVFLHEVITLQFTAQEKDIEPTISPRAMNDGYFYLTTLFGYLNPDRAIYKPKL